MSSARCCKWYHFQDIKGPLTPKFQTWDACVTSILLHLWQSNGGECCLECILKLFKKSRLLIQVGSTLTIPPPVWGVQRRLGLCTILCQHQESIKMSHHRNLIIIDVSHNYTSCCCYEVLFSDYQTLTYLLIKAWKSGKNLAVSGPSRYHGQSSNNISFKNFIMLLNKQVSSLGMIRNASPFFGLNNNMTVSGYMHNTKDP